MNQSGKMDSDDRWGVLVGGTLWKGDIWAEEFAINDPELCKDLGWKFLKLLPEWWIEDQWVSK